MQYGDLNQSGHVDSEFVNVTEKSRCTLTMTTTKTSTVAMDTLETRTWTGEVYNEQGEEERGWKFNDKVIEFLSGHKPKYAKP